MQLCLLQVYRPLTCIHFVRTESFTSSCMRNRTALVQNWRTHLVFLVPACNCSARAIMFVVRFCASSTCAAVHVKPFPTSFRSLSFYLISYYNSFMSNLNDIERHSTELHDPSFFPSSTLLYCTESHVCRRREGRLADSLASLLRHTTGPHFGYKQKIPEKKYCSDDLQHWFFFRNFCS